MMAESEKQKVARRISRYPRDSIHYFNEGFAAASKLSEDARMRVLQEMISNFKRGNRRITGAALEHVTGLPAAESEQVSAAFSLVTGLLSDLSATPEDFIDSATKVLFEPENEATALSIATLVCSNREEVAAAIAQAALTGMVLPSLAELDVVIDVRVRIADGGIKTSVPVAILHIDTDANLHELWMQLSMSDVEETIKKLSEALEHMKIAGAAMSGRA